ncbi:MAG: dihydrofolate reductase family protein [Sedimentisphaerales bacterium]
MRKIVVLTFLSLDGVMQAPGGPQEDTSGGFEYGGWVFPYMDEDLGEIMSKQMAQPFDLLLGRKTYDIFASYWPDHEDAWPGINSVTKYVVSHEKRELKWGPSQLIKPDASAEIKKIKNQEGPVLQVHGSSELIQTLLKNDLVDELWLKIFPITLGIGKRLFREGSIPATYKLFEGKVLPSEVIVANYKRAGEVKTGSFG